MLNLIQIQERLKDLPIQAIMQYANGSNPMIPPFLALTELNRRKKMQENAASEQAKEMAGAPSIKEQIEQATGLMALQGSRQRQAAQQQAGMQSKMDMPAPNTMTSEPAQMAAGGSVDDVIPRDYQSGGSVSPDIAMKLAMLMKRRKPGVAGIPLQNMFKRADYAGGGIVAFSNGGASTFDGFSSDSASEPKKEKEEASPRQIARMTRAELQEYYRSGFIPDRVKVDMPLPTDVDARQQIFKEILEGKRNIPRRSEDDVLMAERRPTGLAGISPKPAAGPQQFPAAAVPREAAVGRGIAGLPDIIQRYLNIDPEKVMPTPDRKTLAELKQEQEAANKLFGVSTDPYAELKKRYADIEAQDRRSRAEQPMDQLTQFLTGIAQSRRGAKFGEAGAAGVASVEALRAQQQALNRKQDLDMAALRSAVAEREDAIARGNRDKALAADKEVQEAIKAIQKDKINLIQNQAQMINQSRQVGASETSAQAALLNAMRDRSGEPRLADARVRDALDRLEKNPEYKLLLISKKPEDRTKAEQMRQDAINQAIRGYEATGTGSGLPPGVVVSKIAP